MDKGLFWLCIMVCSFRMRDIAVNIGLASRLCPLP